MWHQVYEYDNLFLAFYKASKRKKYTFEVQKFSADLDTNIRKLALQIENLEVPIGQYTYFTIKDPKERLICAASFLERVYHHAILNIYHESFEQAQIVHSYATRPNKGTHLALYHTLKNNQQGGYWMKLDVKRFFDTINHNVLKKLLSSYFQEKELIQAFVQIIDSYNKEQGKGLPIGNLTSQYFANFYMSFIDRYAQQDLKIHRYIRYMDDIVFWEKDIQRVWYCYHALHHFLQEVLAQEFKPYTLNKAGFPLPFLGFLVTDISTSPNKRNRKKIRKKQIELSQFSAEEQLKRYWILHQFYHFKANIYSPKQQPCSPWW